MKKRFIRAACVLMAVMGSSTEINLLDLNILVEDSSQGFECDYNLAITPAARLTLDLQVVDSVIRGVDTATALGLRANLNF